MSEAYECDICTDLRSGNPPIYIDIDAHERLVGGDLILNDGTRVEYDHAELTLDCCPACSLRVLEAINELKP